MATKSELRDRLDELGAEQPPDDASHADLTRAVRNAEDDNAPTGDDAVPADHAARDADGELCPFYCPGCGRGLKYEGECRGTEQAPHQPIQTVSTDELTSGDPDTHTPAPASA